MSHKTILVVEDNRGHAKLLQIHLHRREIDYPLAIVKSGQEALDYLRQNGDYAAVEPPGLILLDLNLPDISGAELLKTIQGQHPIDQIPRIILTTSDEREDLEACREYGYYSYHVKPPVYDDLADEIRGLLG